MHSNLEKVHEIQLNCYLAEYTVVPNPDDTELVLQGIKPHPITVCHSVVSADTCQKRLWLKLPLACALRSEPATQACVRPDPHKSEKNSESRMLHSLLNKANLLDVEKHFKNF